MNGKCHHIGLFSLKPQELISFYTEKMGFEFMGTKIVSQDWMTRIFGFPSACQLAKLQFGSATLEIFSPQKGTEKLGLKNTASQGYNHWALGVRDKEAYVRELEKKGVWILKLEGTERFIYFAKDLEGNLIEIYQTRE